MIFDLNLRFCAIHIPRCAGVAIARAVRPYLSNHYVCDLVKRHHTAADVREELGDLWRHLYRFAVLRHPCEIIESDYRLTLAEVPLLDEPVAGTWHPRWRARVMRLAQNPSFEGFVRREFLQGWPLPGGFWQTYCLGADGEDLGVEVIRFDELGGRWPALCTWMAIPRCQLPRINHAPGPAPEWPAELRREIESYCGADLARL